MSPIEDTTRIPTQKKRVESIDAFRGFTIFAMIFVIQVSGYWNLPLTFPQFGSAPVSTWKHAGDDGNPKEWAFYEGKKEGEEPTKYRLGKITGGKRGAYNVMWVDDKGTTQARVGVPVTAAKTLHAAVLGEDEAHNIPADEIVAVRLGTGTNADCKFQGVGNGCTFTDLVAPFFVFIVGVCIPLSKASRGPGWWTHALLRTFMLILAGVIYISLIFKLSYFWGILQAIGIAYLMGVVFLQVPGWARWIVIFVISGAHWWAAYHIPWWVELRHTTRPFYTIGALDGDKIRPLVVHCTPWASISYGLCTIIGTIIGDAVKTKEKRVILHTCLITGVAFTAAGYGMSVLGYPINKDYVSSSYALFTAGIGALTLLLFYWIIDIQGFRGWAWLFNVFGANALLAYFMQPVFRIFSTALGTQQYFGHHGGWDGMLWGLIWTMCLWVIVLICNKRGIFWKL